MPEPRSTDDRPKCERCLRPKATDDEVRDVVAGRAGWDTSGTCYPHDRHDECERLLLERALSAEADVSLLYAELTETQVRLHDALLRLHEPRPGAEVVRAQIVSRVSNALRPMLSWGQRKEARQRVEAALVSLRSIHPTTGGHDA